ncbi:MAG TPA: iron-sulfur cluster assembly scaffold protein [Planctomycetota bacterium]|nr:iron-sulfur cluster assembly scaffold protein [Planctomycetota bacterium]
MHEPLPASLLAVFDASRHVGAPPGAQRRGEARNEACGDVVVIWLRVGAGEAGAQVVEAAGFKAQGCPAAMAAAAGACELLEGLRADAGLGESLGASFRARFGEPRAVHRHALALVCEAVRRTL